ncbi:unnamed protein product, partial [Ectocarpus sp. 12 AP-2014]
MTGDASYCCLRTSKFAKTSQACMYHHMHTSFFLSAKKQITVKRARSCRLHREVSNRPEDDHQLTNGVLFHHQSINTATFGVQCWLGIIGAQPGVRDEDTRDRHHKQPKTPSCSHAC